jgi:hypothetical protein
MAILLRLVARGDRGRKTFHYLESAAWRPGVIGARSGSVKWTGSRAKFSAGRAYSKVRRFAKSNGNTGSRKHESTKKLPNLRAFVILWFRESLVFRVLLLLAGPG